MNVVRDGAVFVLSIQIVLKINEQFNGQLLLTELDFVSGISMLVILYRVVQEWRLPVFNRLAKKIELKVFHGPDFVGTKIVNSKKIYNFKSYKLVSYKLKGKSSNDIFAMPLSPFLFFQLICFNPSIVITEGTSNLFNALIGFLYCKLFRKKYIWWSLGGLKDREHKGFRKQLNIIINYLECHSDAIISYSNFGREYFMALGIPKHRIFVATNVIDTDAKIKDIGNYNISEVYKQAHMDSKFNVLYVGALTKVKKVDILIRAFAKLESYYLGQIKLTIIGDGHEKVYLKKLSENLAIKNIQFEGQLFDGVSKYFLASDVFVLPGLGGLAISDALVHGLPVIAGIGDGCEKDLISNWENGIIDESLDEQAIFIYLEKLLNNPVLLEQMKINAKKAIYDKYNIHTYLNQILNAIYSTQKSV